MARFATRYPVDAFDTGVAGLVITSAGTDVPAEHLEAVQTTAEHNSVALLDVTETTPAQPPAIPTAAVPPPPNVEEMQSAPATPAIKIEEAGA